MKNAIKNEESGLGKIMGIIRAYFDYIQIHLDYYRLNLSSRALRFTKMLKPNEEGNTEIENAKEYIGLTKELLDMLMEAVSLGIKDGTIRKNLNPLQTVIFLGSTIDFIVQISPEYKLLLEMYGITAEEYLQHSIDVLLRGLAGEKK